MLRPESLSSKWRIIATICIVLLSIIALTNTYPLNLLVAGKPQQAAATPIARAIAYAKASTPEPTRTHTPTPPPTLTPSPQPTQTTSVTPSATPAPPAPSN